MPLGLLASIGTFELDVAKIIAGASCKRPIKRPGTPDQQARHATSLSVLFNQLLPSAAHC